MLEIAAACEELRDKVISGVCFVRMNQNIAEILTNAMSQANIKRVISTRKQNITHSNRLSANNAPHFKIKYT